MGNIIKKNINKPKSIINSDVNINSLKFYDRFKNYNKQKNERKIRSKRVNLEDLENYFIIDSIKKNLIINEKSKKKRAELQIKFDNEYRNNSKIEINSLNVKKEKKKI